MCVCNRGLFPLADVSAAVHELPTALSNAVFRFVPPLFAPDCTCGSWAGLSTGLSGCAQTPGSQMDTSTSGWAVEGRDRQKEAPSFPLFVSGRSFRSRL